MGRHRDRLEIVVDMLSVVSDGGAKKTHVMYRANLSWEVSNRYLNELMGAGLVSFGSEDCYVLTPRGRRFLDKFSEYCKRREKLEEQLNKVKNERMLLKNMCFNAKMRSESDS